MRTTKENSTHKITFRLNDWELTFLNEFSRSAGISRSDTYQNLIRKIQGNASIIKTDKLLTTLNNLAAKRGRVNNNINQLAKHANQYSFVAEMDPKAFPRFNRLQGAGLRVHSIKRKVCVNFSGQRIYDGDG